MRYVLRADASKLMGAGHVMRSSAIAEELIARGEEVIFVGQISDLPWVEESISSLGFSLIFKQSSDYISRSESDVLILDTYKSEVTDPFLDPENWLHIVAIEELSQEESEHNNQHIGDHCAQAELVIPDIDGRTPKSREIPHQKDHN